MMIGRRSFVACCVGAPFAKALTTESHASPKNLEVPLRILVARCARAPAQPDTWVRSHVEAARTIFAYHGVALSYTLEPFEPTRCEILTETQRNQMAVHATSPNAVTVLVMARVRDLDVPSYDLMGVHWRAQGKEVRDRRWVFLTARANPPVLAHELCHFFGLPHDPAGGNLMTPGPSSPAWKAKPAPKPFVPVLTDAQAARLRLGVGAWLSQHARKDR